MAKTIFVGNLPWAVTDADLSQKFSEFGTVISARVITDTFSGRSRGFGFVDMDDDSADKAISALAGYKWGERELTVNEAKPKTRGDRGDRGSRGGDRGERRFGKSYNSF